MLSLSHIKAQVASHLQAAANSFYQLYRRPFATLATVIIIAITLTLPALFWVFTDNLEQVMAKWRQSGTISLYLDLSLSSADELALLSQVRALPGVGSATLKTRAEALAELQAQEGMADILRDFHENPLPAMIKVMPALTINSPLKLNQLFNTLKTLPHLGEAKVDMEWVSRLQTLLNFITKLTHVLMGLLALAVVLIIGNTLRLTLHRRHEEIRVLKLIGATDSFILRPFIYSGVWYGIAGALVAILLINIFLLSFGLAIQKLAKFYSMNYVWFSMSIKQAYFIVFSAIGLGWIGAHLSVKNQLSSIEPQN